MSSVYSLLEYALYKKIAQQYLCQYSEADILPDIGFPCNANYIFQNLYRSPIELLFFWIEEEFDGKVFAIYLIEDVYIVCQGDFSNVPGYDYFLGTLDINELHFKTDCIHYSSRCFGNLDEIGFSSTAHFDLVESFNEFVKQHKFKQNIAVNR
jgi:hypothetical protein